jgi:hypothetical protein
MLKKTPKATVLNRGLPVSNSTAAIRPIMKSPAHELQDEGYGSWLTAAVCCGTDKKGK